jgi:hypothetical protein
MSRLRVWTKLPRKADFGDEALRFGSVRVWRTTRPNHLLPKTS